MALAAVFNSPFGGIQHAEIEGESGEAEKHGHEE